MDDLARNRCEESIAVRVVKGSCQILVGEAHAVPAMVAACGWRGEVEVLIINVPTLFPEFGAKLSFVGELRTREG